MTGDLTVGIVLRADGSQLKGELAGSGAALDRVKGAAAGAAAGARELSRDTGNAGTALRRVRDGAEGAAGGARALARDTAIADTAMRQLNATAARQPGLMQRNRFVIQQFGFQVGDVATQLQLGANAMQVFAIQGSQMLQVFGPAGAILGAVVAIGGAVGAAMLGLNDRTKGAANSGRDLNEVIEVANELLATNAERTRAATAARVELTRVELEGQQRTLIGEVESAERKLAAAERELELLGLQRNPRARRRALLQDQADIVEGERLEVNRLRASLQAVQRLRDRLLDPSSLGAERERAQRQAAAGIRAGDGPARGSFRAAQEAGMDADFGAIVAEGRFRAEEAAAKKAAGAMKEVAATFDVALARARSWREGAGDALRDYARDAMDVAANTASAFQRGFSSMENAIVGFRTKGIAAFGDFANAVIDDLIRIQVRASITGPLSEALGSLFAPARPQNASVGAGGLEAGNVVFDAPSFHSGRGPGDAQPGGGARRRVPAAAFHAAPRFHAGILPGELAAVIREDESVLTPGQMRTLAGARAPAVNVQIVNTTGQPARAGERRGAGGSRDLVIVVGEAMARDVRSGGPLHSAIADTFGARQATDGR